ncbi:FmdE family protein [Desulfolucanica intricata]|uniref:FmdE family protein n=1 Tax=Desulfolucanica intricata TaxID=1285191 RepID=UPI000830B612|nr:FmdE family protein [Desulfolucanica intricata]
MCREKTDWERAIEFHGHSCPGLATGFRVAQIALEKLNEFRSQDEELVAIVENDACGVDAVMLLTGCTLGKGNLIYRDLGKQVYTFGSRNSNQALRISVNSEMLHRQSPAATELRIKVFGGTATPEEKEEFAQMQQQKIDRILNMPAEEFCKAEKIEFNMPGKARIFNSVKCHRCGEYVMEPRARVRNGEFVCIPCADEYTRGW